MVMCVDMTVFLPSQESPPPPPPPPPLVSMNKVWQLAQNGKCEAGAQTLATIIPKLLEACRLTIANYILCESTNYAFKREDLFSQ